jgi:hypothetical protein
MMDCLVFTSEITPRIAYVLEVIFDQLPGVRYRTTTDKSKYLSYEGPKINYSRERLADSEIFIAAGPLLFENNIHSIEIEVEKQDDVPYFFKMKAQKADFEFDLPAMLFYLISRYEEYLPFEADEHDRFPAKQSLAFKNDFLELPLVNIWIAKLRQLLNSKFPDLQIPVPEFKYVPTYDVDMAWAFLNRGWRSWGGLVKDLIMFNTKMLGLRLKVFRGKLPDPFFTFDYLNEIHKKYHLSPKWFFLLGNYGKFDKNISWKNTDLQKLIRAVAPKENIGIHPSYASNTDYELLEKETLRLAKIKKSTVFNSRQHYLKLSIPNTYRYLLQVGVQADFTMGFADAVGFRASIANPFQWYDLEKEQVTSLVIHPFQVMDVTLKNYLKLSPNEAIEKVTTMAGLVKKYGGTFSTLWHNSSFSALHGWSGWKKVYEEIIEKVSG